MNAESVFSFHLPGHGYLVGPRSERPKRALEVTLGPQAKAPAFACSDKLWRAAFASVEGRGGHTGSSSPLTKRRRATAAAYIQGSFKGMFRFGPAFFRLQSLLRWESSWISTPQKSS